jgi:hypothetical protein
LLTSWVQRYHEAEGKIWRAVVDYKYVIYPNIFYCNPRNISPFWKG